MSSGVSNVNYSYAVGTIGSEDIDVSKTISSGSSLQDIYNEYKGLFEDYSKIHGTLLAQMNTVLKQVGNKAYSGKLDLESIFDDNVLIDTNNLKDGKCKEGARAYKYYLREVVMQLNTLFVWKDKASECLEQLKNLTEGEDLQESKAHYLITQLEIADQHVQDAIKAFTKHTVIKDLTVNKFTHYSEEVFDQVDVFTAYETAYNGVFDSKSGQYTSMLKYAPDLEKKSELGSNPETKDISGAADLKYLVTTKYTVQRIIETYCYKDAEMSEYAGKYDDLVYRKTTTKEISSTSKIGKIALFDELPLLDKLKYIIIYYHKDNAANRYIFPSDAATGFPCVQPTDNKSPTEDINELGQLEMFYIGYLVDRDGPVNALASFMEVKATAIKDQIVLLSYRVKALQYYIKLLNKGLEKLTASQSEGKQTIPEVSCRILRFLGANVTRSLMYLKDSDGKFLKDVSGNKLTNPYIILQYNGDNPDEDNGDEGYHLTNSGVYILVEASDEGVDAFLTWEKLYYTNGDAESIFSRSFDTNSFTSLKICEECIEADTYEIGTKTKKTFRGEDHYCKAENPPKTLFLKVKSYASSDAKACLPKELEVSRLDMTTLVSDNFGGVSGMSWKNISKNTSSNNWTTFISTWTTQYDTVISNYQSQLEYVQKSIASLRKKIDTFDSMSSNFRNKAYSIYNKIVIKIS